MASPTLIRSVTRSKVHIASITPASGLPKFTSIVPYMRSNHNSTISRAGKNNTVIGIGTCFNSWIHARSVGRRSERCRIPRSLYQSVPQRRLRSCHVLSCHAAAGLERQDSISRREDERRKEGQKSRSGKTTSKCRRQSCTAMAGSSGRHVFDGEYSSFIERAWSSVGRDLVPVRRYCC